MASEQRPGGGEGVADSVVRGLQTHLHDGVVYVRLVRALHVGDRPGVVLRELDDAIRDAGEPALAVE